MSIELKIKSKHLGEEARVIRHEEQKLKKQSAWLREKFGPELSTPTEGKSWYNWPRTPLGVTQDKLQCISSHRKWEVRNENRATFLARAFLAGKPYRSVEAKVKDQSRFDSYILPRLLKLVAKYAEKGQDASKEAVRAWLDA